MTKDNIPEAKQMFIKVVIFFSLFIALLLFIGVLIPWVGQISCASEIQACKYFHAEPRECIIRARCL